MIVELTCAFCSNQFNANKTPSYTPRFCNKTCSARSRNAPIEDRLISRGKWEGDCFVWQGSKNEDNYGCTSYNGKLMKVHRLSYEVFVGPIPDGLLVMHSCDNPPCYNPEHLSVGTMSDNILDCARKERHGAINLSNKVVAEIIQRVSEGERQYKLAEEYGVARSTINRYVSGVRRG